MGSRTIFIHSFISTQTKQFGVVCIFIYERCVNDVGLPTMMPWRKGSKGYRTLLLYKSISWIDRRRCELLFNGPVRGAFCGLSRHGSRSFDWEFCFNSRPSIFYAGSLTLSVDSTTFSFLFFFILLYACIRSFYFYFCFSRRFVSCCYSFPRSNYRLFITC